MNKRYIFDNIVDDLQEKMVFLAGPRQVGKTTLAQYIAKEKFKRSNYFNWDKQEHRNRIIKELFDQDVDFIIFDELHKYPEWKNYIKGIFDVDKNKYQILVTGSARLDVYKKGGDSLMGRYHYYRLHPFSLGEALVEKLQYEVGGSLQFPFSSKQTKDTFNILLQFGAFPEPFIKQNMRTLRRWQRQRVDKIVREDIRDIEIIRDLAKLELLVDILPSKVGSKFSLNSIKEDLKVSYNTVSDWLDILDRFYYTFRIYPYASTLIKSLRKEAKLYLWDWSVVKDGGHRLENLVASHLLKFVHYLEDTQGYRASLNYIRDIDGREVDFLVSIDEKPWFAVEVKSSDTNISKHLRYFMNKIKIPYAFQLTQVCGVDVQRDDVRLMSVEKFLAGLV